MIPQQLLLAGFMSYREPTTINFEGATLWALVGRNGAGKSAIFDAITYVLYGLHRGGKQDHADLINHQKDSLLVQFDFQLGADVFRVKRTRARRGHASYQAWQGMASGSTSVWQTVPLTDSKAGFDDWVKRTIGLADDTFTAAVLLQQGKSDLLLTADPRERHAMLTQVLDLSMYERLQRVALQRHEESAATTREIDRQLQVTPPVTAEAIAACEEEIVAAGAAMQSARTNVERLVAWRPQAERWEYGQRQGTHLQAQINAADTLLSHAEEIEQAAARLSELRTVVPQLQRLLGERQRRADQGAEHARHQEQQRSAAERAGQQRTAQAAAQADVDRLVAGLEQHRVQERSALQVVASTTPHIATLNDLEHVRHALAVLDDRLLTFPADLDAKHAHHAERVAMLCELATARPWLSRYALARDTWHKARASLTACQVELQSLARELTTTCQERDSLAAQSAAASQVHNIARDAQLAARHTLTTVEEHLIFFGEVDGQPECRYCGQVLTPEHLERERERLLAEKAAAQQQHAEAEQAVEAAWLVVERRNSQLQVAAAGLERLAMEQQRLATEETLARQQQRQAEELAQAALDALVPAYANAILGEPPQSLPACFAQTYPTPDDLNAQATALQALPEERRSVDRLGADLAARNTHSTERQLLLERINATAARYPAELAQRLRGEHAAARSALADLEPTIEQARHDLATARELLAASTLALETATEQQRVAALAAEAAAARTQEIDHTLADLAARLPEAWRTGGTDWTPGQVTVLQQEERQLDGADLRANELAIARTTRDDLARQLTAVRQELEAIPLEARRPVPELEQATRDAREQDTAATEHWRQAEGQRVALLAHREQRRLLEERGRGSRQRAYLHGELARYLGRDHLQRHLLRQAETGIVEHANDVLDRLSGGDLRLDLRSDGDSGKALDLVSYNRQIDNQPVQVALLSGSQRFRVAVSLAIGIGRFAGDSARPMESVIIDEGFGSLDREGLAAMSDELDRLSNSNLLRRIILVSHQEEFAEHFPHRYEIRLDDGNSTVALANC